MTVHLLKQFVKTYFLRIAKAVSIIICRAFRLRIIVAIIENRFNSIKKIARTRFTIRKDIFLPIISVMKNDTAKDSKSDAAVPPPPAPPAAPAAPKLVAVKQPSGARRAMLEKTALARKVRKTIEFFFSFLLPFRHLPADAKRFLAHMCAPLCAGHFGRKPDWILTLPLTV